MKNSLPARSAVRFLLAAALWLGHGAGAAGQAYDPLALAPGAAPEVADLTIRDAKRQRDIPVRVYLPRATSPAPVILFSHGLGGSREYGRYLGEHWAVRGYAAVFLQHPGSDESVWKGARKRQRMQAMQEAANAQNLLLRAGDVTAALDQLERWNAERGHKLAGRLDLARIGMSGHSFGAITTQAVCGQKMGGSARLADQRISAALIFSPSSPRQGSPQQAFSGITMPWLLMTGTEDVSPIGGIDVASRLAVYPALPPGGKYELVLDGATHSAFSDRPRPGSGGSSNPNHHRAILALSTAFWDTYLRGDARAKEWLHGAGPKSVLEPRDRWQMK
jgi:dienelactone hydrolase